jgi:radical SAM protein with 4Fe4S-binding SPASM domain
VETIEALKKLNCIVFLMLKPKGDRNTLTQLTDLGKYKGLIEYALCKKVGIGFDSCSAPSFLRAMQGHPEYENFKQCADPCESTCFSMYFNVDGISYPCSFTEDQPDYKGIDVKLVQDFTKEVWNGEETVKFRKRLLDNKDQSGCRNCPEFNLKMDG